MIPGSKHRVLVVDDNRDAATTMSELLVSAGFDVETYFDGPTALSAALRFKPDACILDIAMPGLDGYELARQLRERLHAHPPIFATMTAYGDYNHLERAVDAGFDLQFTKPAEPRDVIEQLKQHIETGKSFVDTHIEQEAVAPEADRKTVLHRVLTRLTGLWSKPESESK